MSYILKYLNEPGQDNYVGMDFESGGYPYRTSWDDVDVWHNLGDAIRYANRFTSEHLGLFHVVETDKGIRFDYIDTNGFSICPNCHGLITSEKGGDE